MKDASSAVVLTLAVALGANTALFSAADALLLRPLPYAHPDRLVALSALPPGSRTRAAVSPPDFLSWRDAVRSASEIAAFRPWGFVLTGSGPAERLTGARVSANLFPLLGVRPIVGREFLPSEDRFGAAGVVIVSDRVWRQRLGAAPDLTNLSIRLNGIAHAVVGVMPPDFRLPQADVWVPLSLEPFALVQRGNRALTVVARLNDSVTIAAAQADMDAVSADLARRYPDADAGWSTVVEPLSTSVQASMRPTLLTVWGAVVLVLLIACANTAGLMLARAGARRQEIAVRQAIGATRGRIIRQLLGESLKIALVAGALGVPLAIGLLRALVAIAPPELSRLADATVDLRVAAFTVAIALATGLLFGVVPALRGSHEDLSPLLGSVRQVGGGHTLFRHAAVGCQLAVAMVVLLTAMLLVRSYARVQAIDAGFDASRLLTMAISPDQKYGDPARRAAFFDDLLPRLAAIPGVESAGLISHMPLAAATLTVDVSSPERPAGGGRPALLANYSSVGGDWFQTMRIPIRQGRPFTPHDGPSSPPVVVISENLARLLWPDGDAIGRHLVIGGTIGADTRPREIVGVAGNVRAVLEREPPLQMYVPYAQNPWPTMGIALRTKGDPAALTASVRSAVSAIDPDQAAYNVRPFDEILARATSSRRFQMLIVSTFAAFALALSLVGVFTVVTYAVGLRTAEIGVRLALGAPARSILLLAARESVVWSLGGLAGGAAVALAVSRGLAGLLYGVAPSDPLALGVSTAAVTALVLLASAAAARRATALDPLAALRSRS